MQLGHACNCSAFNSAKLPAILILLRLCSTAGQTSLEAVYLVTIGRQCKRPGFWKNCGSECVPMEAASTMDESATAPRLEYGGRPAAQWKQRLC